MKILFIGGNGNISWYCTQEAIKHGHEVWQLNREQSLSTRREIQKEVHKLKGDINESENIKRLLEGCYFDVVCDFICYNGEQAKQAMEIFKNRTKHFVFISSEAVYKRVSYNIPYKETSEKYDMDLSECKYIRGKLEAEQVFEEAYKEREFPITIIRPAYTYDTIFPTSIGHNCFTVADLIMKGYPLLVAGDGTNLWTFTHSSDFARAFISLIELPDIKGEVFHISTEEWLSWNEQSEIVLNALGMDKSNIFHVPFQDALKLEKIQPKELMYQRMWHNIYCVDKVKNYVPDWSAKVSFEEGIQKTIRWLEAKQGRKRYIESLKKEIMNIYTYYGVSKDV